MAGVGIRRDKHFQLERSTGYAGSLEEEEAASVEGEGEDRAHIEGRTLHRIGVGEGLPLVAELEFEFGSGGEPPFGSLIDSFSLARFTGL